MTHGENTDEIHSTAQAKASCNKPSQAGELKVTLAQSSQSQAEMGWCQTQQDEPGQATSCRKEQN